MSRAQVSLAVSSREVTVGVGVCRSPSASFSKRETQDWMGLEMDRPTRTAMGKEARTTRATTRRVSMMLRSRVDLNSRWLASMAMLQFWLPPMGA